VPLYDSVIEKKIFLGKQKYWRGICQPPPSHAITIYLLLYRLGFSKGTGPVLGTHHVCCPQDAWNNFPREKSGLSVNMTAYLCLVLRLIKNGATTSLRHTLLWPCAKGQVYCHGCHMWRARPTPGCSANWRWWVSHPAVAARCCAIRPVLPFMDFCRSLSVTISWLRKSRLLTVIKHPLPNLSDAVVALRDGGHTNRINN
jgi:hypothetical protein